MDIFRRDFFHHNKMRLFPVRYQRQLQCHKPRPSTLVQIVIELYPVEYFAQMSCRNAIPARLLEISQLAECNMVVVIFSYHRYAAESALRLHELWDILYLPYHIAPHMVSKASTDGMESSI